jgi:fucose 4-O-acetylase-like acetyltransferase
LRHRLSRVLWFETIRRADPIDATPTTTTLSRRDPTVDGLKFIAAAAIVMVHVAMQPRSTPLPSFVEQVSYSALYFFFLVAGYFHGALGKRGPKWLGRRFVRLAVPYGVWSVIFILWWNLYHFVKGWPLYFPDPVRVIFFAGAAEVLWSLPWLFACALLAELFARTPATRRLLLFAAAAIQLGVWVFLPNSALPNYAIRQYIEGGRWVVMYVLGMELRAIESVHTPAVAWTALAALASLDAGGLAILAGPQPTRLVPQLVMFFLNASVAVALLVGSRAGARWLGARALAWGGDYLLGVYVSHGLWLAILVRFVPARSMPVWAWLPFGWAVCFGAAVLVTKLLLSSRWTRPAVI